MIDVFAKYNRISVYFVIIGIPESNLVLVRILVRPALLAGREKGGTMRKLVSCEFNIDTACVELRYADGEVLSIYTPGVDDSFDTTIAMRAEMDWLIYNDPLEYAQMVLDGSLESYLRRVSGKHSLELDD